MSVAKKEQKSVKAWVRITPKTKKALDQLAEQHDMSTSQFMRLVLFYALKKQLAIKPIEQA